MNSPNSRSSHKQEVPSLGGIAFYICLIFGLLLIEKFDLNEVSISISASLMILFIIGMKDDLTVLRPITKLGAQLLAISIILINPAFHFDNLHGFLGITDISMGITIPLSAFVMLSIINSYNLIDGIDGLASIVGIIILIIFSVLFFYLKELYFFFICVLLIGSLLAFLRYNLSYKKKIFMGDTGTMIIGLIIAVMTLEVFTVPKEQLKELPIYIENLPLIVIAILVVPLFDTARVFTIRILNRNSPFKADRNHIHHILIDYLKFTHKKASIAIGIANLLFTIAFIILSSALDNFTLLMILLIAILLMVYFFYRINFSYKNIKRRILFKKRMHRLGKKANFFS